MSIDDLLPILYRIEASEREMACAKAELMQAIMALREREPRTHSYAPPQHVAPFCAPCDDDPPSRPV